MALAWAENKLRGDFEISQRAYERYGQVLERRGADFSKPNAIPQNDVGYMLCHLYCLHCISSIACMANGRATRRIYAIDDGDSYCFDPIGRHRDLPFGFQEQSICKGKGLFRLLVFHVRCCIYADISSLL